MLAMIRAQTLFDSREQQGLNPPVALTVYPDMTLGVPSPQTTG